jgi:aspartyl-tRNA(Asn)/glutamyl-tRNA(Gln) amidotransferase subunit A
MASAVRGGHVSAHQIVSEVLDRIQRVDPSVNAYALLDAEGALRQAQDSDRARAAGAPVGPLEGVPFHVKDLLPTAGLETSYGSWAMAGNIPKTDLAAVARMKKAGAILLGKTTTPEFGTKIQTDSPRYGFTRNPWRLDRSPGGSSGGSAAAVACGMGPLALNTDGAGSARVPASCCGVIGYKPSLGLVPNEMAAALFENNQYVGVNTRTVADLALALTVINGADPGDPWTLGRPPKSFTVPGDRFVSMQGMRVLYVPMMGNHKLDPHVEASMAKSLRCLQDAGVQVLMGPEQFDWGVAVSIAWLRGMLKARLSPLLASHRDRLDPDFIGVLEGADDGTPAERATLPLQRTELFRRVQQLFEVADLIVSPTVAAPPIGLHHRTSEPLVIAGEEVGSLRRAWYPYTGVANMTGHPAISIPIDMTPDGLPIGLQAMGRLHEDQVLINLAAALEQAQPWAERWPSGWA